MHPYKHCGYCGSSAMSVIAETPHWQCGDCGQITWVNPRPVICLITRLKDNRDLPSGVLIIRRGIEPAKGGWALPGGFMEMGETIAQTASRELQEEVGIVVLPENIRVRGDTPSDGCSLIFCETIKPVSEAELWATFEPCKEATEAGVIRQRSEITNVCWSTHRDALTDFFDTLGRR